MLNIGAPAPIPPFPKSANSAGSVPVDLADFGVGVALASNEPPPSRTPPPGPNRGTSGSGRPDIHQSRGITNRHFLKLTRHSGPPSEPALAPLPKPANSVGSVPVDLADFGVGVAQAPGRLVDPTG